MQTEQSIRELLQSSHTIAVVGLSNKPERASHGVAHYLQQQGYRILPVNPTYEGTNILGEYCYATLTDAANAIKKQGGQIDIVDCFRQSNAIGPVADEAIAIGARCLWLQLGVVNDEAIAKAKKAGMIAIQDHCIKVEHVALGLG
jgi:predicted CoA-binding protein